MKLEQSICYGSRQAVMQNLIDAGCSKDMIDDLMKQLAEDDMESLLQMLENIVRVCLAWYIRKKSRLTVWIIWFIRSSAVKRKNRGKEG